MEIVSYQVLARKYRPQTFDEVVGQEHVIQTLKNAISLSRIAHAYLFVGPRGIGKTSTARILAKALNVTGGPKADFDPNDDICKEIAEGRCMDVIEIDGASNNGVDHIRDLRETVQYSPIRGKYKIYIIDEVHMLSQGAFNALLKTLEEPPAHVVFIFATTEAHKVPSTILSRCQRFDLKRISDSAIAKHLAKISKLEGFDISEDALLILARNAEGGLRDAESSLDQLVNFCGKKINEDDVLSVFGLTGWREILPITQALSAGDQAGALNEVRVLAQKGKDLLRLTQELTRYFRDQLIHVISPETAEGEISLEKRQHFSKQAVQLSKEDLLAITEELLRLEEKIRFALVKEVAFEIGMLKIAQLKQRVQIEKIIHQLSEGKEVTTTFSPAPPAEKKTIVSSPDPKNLSILKESVAASDPELVASPAKAEPITEAVSAPTPKPSASSSVEPSALWDEVKIIFKRERPMMGRAIEACTFESYEAPVYTIRMEAEEISHTSLQNPRNWSLIESLVQDKLGSDTKLKMTYIPVIREPDPINIPVPVVKPKPAAKKDDKSEPFNASDFQDDPLIKQALQEFEARIVSVKTAQQ
jgi:DNA polymerase-3 subunit gamma/tau